jgi:hypothetical protein
LGAVNGLVLDNRSPTIKDSVFLKLSNGAIALFGLSVEKSRDAAVAVHGAFDGSTLGYELNSGYTEALRSGEGCERRPRILT